YSPRSIRCKRRSIARNAHHSRYRHRARNGCTDGADCATPRLSRQSQTWTAKGWYSWDMLSPELERLIHDVPKVELHLHIEGTLEPEMVFALAKKHGVEVPH